MDAKSAAQERFAFARDGLIAYEKRPGDPGEILGVVVYAMGHIRG